MIDTNILVYMLNPVSPYHESAQSAVRTFYYKGSKLYLAPQILRETWVVLTRTNKGYRWSAKQAADAFERMLHPSEGIFQVLSDPPTFFARWLEMVSTQGITGARAHDAAIAAFAELHGMDAILTFNKDDFLGLFSHIIHPKEV